MDNNYGSNNNYNYADEGFGFDTFNPDTSSAQYENGYNTNYSEPTGFAGLQTLALEKVVTKSFLFMFVA